MTSENHRSIEELKGNDLTSTHSRMFMDDFLNEIETWRSKWFILTNETTQVCIS